MKCFVASALGHNDVDEVYDRCVRPTLKRLGITPLRVDRVEHNEDIDDKIFALLEAADLALADLTYARPSVYYEAGYAAGRKKPVIYIARSDHFGARDDDLDGLRRIHFDLQMKNIIPWKAADKTFTARLEKRLKHVLKPLLKEQDVEKQLRVERETFASLPQSTRLTWLARYVREGLESRSFAVKEWGLRPTWTQGVKILDSGREKTVVVICTPSALKAELQGIEVRSSFIRDLPREPLPANVDYVIASLKPVPEARASDALQTFHRVGTGTFLRKDTTRHGEKIVNHVQVIGGIQSEREFTDAFDSLLQRIDHEKSKK